MGPRFYVIPWAAVSLNDAYATRWGQARRFLVPTFKRFKELVTEVLIEQDGGQPPKHDTYRCEYLFLYQEAELFSDAQPQQRRKLQADPVYASIDISNLFKMTEDALFAHLNGGWDHRVTDLIGRKRCVKTLPAPIERYTDDVLGRLPAGNILIRIEESAGMLLSADDVAYRRFEPALGGAELLSKREGKPKMLLLPEYLELPTTDFGSVRVDPVDDYRRWAEATTDRARFRVLRDMARSRVAWLKAWKESQSVESLALKFLNKEILNASWRELVGSRPQRDEVKLPKVQAFNRSWAWVYDSLRRECTTSSMLRIGQLLKLSESLGTGKKIAIVGSGGGTWIYPFAAHNHRVTAFEFADSPLLKCAKRRNAQNFLHASFVDWDYDRDRSPATSDTFDGFDCVVCLDVIDRLPNAELLLQGMTRVRRDLLIVSFTFKDRRGKAVRRLRPWVYTSWDGIADAKVHVRKQLMRKLANHSFELVKGSTWAKDLLPLVPAEGKRGRKDKSEV